MKIKDLLIVEDDKQITDMFNAFLDHIPISYVTVSNGTQALKKLKTTKFKVMLIDIGLEGSMNGVDLCILIRKSEKKSEIYAMTGFTKLFETIEPEVAGFNGVFYKPIVYKKLLNGITTAINNVVFD